MVSPSVLPGRRGRGPLLEGVILGQVLWNSTCRVSLCTVCLCALNSNELPSSRVFAPLGGPSPAPVLADTFTWTSQAGKPSIVMA